MEENEGEPDRLVPEVSAAWFLQREGPEDILRAFPKVEKGTAMLRFQALISVRMLAAFALQNAPKL